MHQYNDFFFVRINQSTMLNGINDHIMKQEINGYFSMTIYHKVFVYERGLEYV